MRVRGPGAGKTPIIGTLVSSPRSFTRTTNPWPPSSVASRSDPPADAADAGISPTAPLQARSGGIGDHFFRGERTTGSASRGTDAALRRAGDRPESFRVRAHRRKTLPDEFTRDLRKLAHIRIDGDDRPLLRNGAMP